MNVYVLSTEPHFQFRYEREGATPSYWGHCRKSVEDACNAVRLAFPLFGCIAIRWEMNLSGLRLVTTMVVPDRDTGKSIALYSATDFTADQVLYLSRGDDLAVVLAEFVRDVLRRKVLEHEMDEMIHVRGKRLGDPHNDD